MKYKIGDFIIFLHGFKSGNIATSGTIVSIRESSLPEAKIYTVYHSNINRSIDYSGSMLEMQCLSGNEYLEKFGNRNFGERRGL